MRNWGNSPRFLIALNCLCFSVAYADDIPSATTSTSSDAVAPATATGVETNVTSATATDTPSTTPTEDVAPTSANSASAENALKQKSTDSSSEKSLQEVFQASEKTYSLVKKGKFSMNYDLSYSFFRDTRIDIALSESNSNITRFRIQEDAQHSFTNTIDVSYGLRDNLTFNTSLPLVYKMDTLGGKEAIGLGDVSFGLRWQPIPLKRGLPTTTLFSTFSTATGDSPYEINSSNDLSTGKGYYSLSAGASMSKITDPLVIYGSASFTTGNSMGGLNQARSGGSLTSVSPGQTLGMSFGFAYSLNYDVSLSASYSQSISTNSRFAFENGAVIEPQTQVSSVLNYTLSLRTSPKRIINLSLGIGLSEDTPDVNLGFSMPLEFLGLAKE